MAAESLNEKVTSAAAGAKQSIDEAGKAAANELDKLWGQTVRNRTPDEVVAWVIMGLLVGGVLAQFMKVKRGVAFFLGLVGAILGGIVVHVTKVNLGLGPVLIRFEDLLFSLVGSVLLVVAIRLVTKPKQPKT